MTKEFWFSQIKKTTRKKKGPGKDNPQKSRAKKIVNFFANLTL